MRVKVLFFAAVADLLGRREAELQLPEGTLTVQQFTSHLVAEFPLLEAYLSEIRIAVNEEFANVTTIVCDGDVVALIPPVSGG